MFDHLKQSADLDKLEMLRTIGPSATTLEKIEAILDEVVDVYDKLCTAQIWIKEICST